MALLNEVANSPGVTVNVSARKALIGHVEEHKQVSLLQGAQEGKEKNERDKQKKNNLKSVITDKVRSLSTVQHFLTRLRLLDDNNKWKCVQNVKPQKRLQRNPAGSPSQCRKSPSTAQV